MQAVFFFLQVDVNSGKYKKKSCFFQCSGSKHHGAIINIRNFLYTLQPKKLGARELTIRDLMINLTEKNLGGARVQLGLYSYFYLPVYIYSVSIDLIETEDLRYQIPRKK